MKSIFIALFIALLAVSACTKKPDEPSPTAQLDTLMTVTNVKANSFSILSVVTSIGSERPITMGHCWSSTNSLPTIDDQKTKIPQPTVPAPYRFASDIPYLEENTTYYVRAYVTAGLQTTYSDVKQVRTKPGLLSNFSKTLEDSLRNRDFGYGFVILQQGIVKGEGSGGLKARMADVGGEKPYTLDTKMHIASMSKTITTMAFLKLAAEKKIPTNTPIASYLPTSWTKGPNLQRITFRDLLTHRSGIVGLGSSCSNGAYSENIYSGLKQLAEKGIIATNRGNYCYQNANFGLFRILIPAILGYQFTGNDAVDDTQTQQLYTSYVQTQVLDKAGISASPASPQELTYTYDYPYSGGPGWNQGHFNNTAGAYGWYLSPREAGKLYSQVLTTTDQTILPTAYKDTLIQNRLGCFGGSVSGSPYYFHDGWWYLKSTTFKGIRTAWVLLPNQVVVVLFSNSLHAVSGLFPSNNGDDIITVINRAYVRAQQIQSGRQMAEIIHMEDPQPH